MYKNLNAEVLGVSGRQSELIELAMTYGFKGLDIDITEVVKRTARTDFERAARYLLSSKLKVGGFDVPVDLDADDASFETALAALPETIEVAGKLGAYAGFLALPAATDRLAFPEYFEILRKRVERIAALFEKNKVLLGLSFSTAAEDREGKQFKFIQDVASFLAFFQACSSEAVALVIDTFDWTIGGGTMEQLASIPGKRVAALRISDLAKVSSVTDCTKSLRLLSGTHGTIDNVQFVVALNKSGYEGPVTSFADPSNFAGVTRVSIVAKSQDALDHALAGAGIPTFTRRPDMVFDSRAPIMDEIGIDA